MDIRYERKDPVKERQEVLQKYEKMFREKANQLNINVKQLDTINTTSETIYNPYNYNYTTRWEKLFK